MSWSRRLAVAAGIAAAVALVALGLQLVDGSDADESGRTATKSAVGGSTVVPIVKVAPGDFREYEELATRTNTRPGLEPLTELRFEVALRDTHTPEWSSYCSGDPDTWYVVVVGRSGPTAWGPCDQSVPHNFPTIPRDISPFSREGAEPAPTWVRMFVTRPIPRRHLACFARRSWHTCKDLRSRPSPLASTDVTFGVSLYEYWAPPVATVADVDVSARVSADGTDYVVRQVLAEKPGRSSVETTLRATDAVRLVAVLDTYTRARIDCFTVASSDAESGQCIPRPELRIGDRTVPLALEQVGDLDVRGSPYGFFLVPAGDQEVEVRVRSGDPDNVELALVVFEEAG